jgi:hypothetical protein
MLFVFEEGFECATVTVLVYEIEVVDCLEHVEVLDDVGGGFEVGEDADFVVGAFLQLRVLFKLLGAYLLDGYLLIRLEVEGSEHCGVCTVADLILEGIVFYQFAHVQLTIKCIEYN